VKRMREEKTALLDKTFKDTFSQPLYNYMAQYREIQVHFSADRFCALIGVRLV